MRQLVSIIKDNQAHFAVVDEGDGTIIPFADLLIPDPDRFGLHESAVLGTNLMQALGLNGTKRPKMTIPRVGEVIPGSPVSEAVEPEPARELPAPKNETARERRNRLAREHYARKSGRNTGKTGRPVGRPPRRDPSNTAERYISIDEVMAVVNQYPEGIRLRDVANRIWRQTDGKGTDEAAPHWVYTSCSNRLTHARERLKSHGDPMPFREEERLEPKKDGKPGTIVGKYLMPLLPPVAEPSPAPPSDPFAPDRWEQQPLA